MSDEMFTVTYRPKTHTLMEIDNIPRPQWWEGWRFGFFLGAIQEQIPRFW